MSEAEDERAFPVTLQRALAAVSAHRRGDLDGAELMLNALGDDSSRAGAFFALAELSLVLWSEQTGEDWDALTQALSLSMAHVSEVS